MREFYEVITEHPIATFLLGWFIVIIVAIICSCFNREWP